jgi:hypothetical protein
LPLSEHEQRILEDIERRLKEDDPRLADTVATTSLYRHLARRIRWASLAFLAGFVMLLLFFLSLWVALAGFVVMLVSALYVYGAMKQIGQDQLRTLQQQGGFSLASLLARLSGQGRSSG